MLKCGRAASRAGIWATSAIFFLSCLMAGVSLSPVAFGAPDASRDSPATALGSPLAAIFKDYDDFSMRENPFEATLNGVSGFNDKVPDVSPAGYAHRESYARALLARLDAADPAADPVSAEILRFILKHEIALAQHRIWRAPFLSDHGFHLEFGQAAAASPFKTERDYRDYLERLRRLPDYFEQNIANMRQGIEEGFVQPKEIMAGVLPSFDAQAALSAEDHPLFAPFQSISNSLPADRQRKLRAEAKQVMERDVLPSFRKLATFMREEYAPSAADIVGAAALPDGTSYYQALLRFYTTRDDSTAEEIHQVGLAEVARIRAEMEAVKQEAGFEGSFTAFQNFLRTDPRFYATAPDELLMRAAAIAKDIDGRLPAYFGRLPRQPFTIKPVPAEIAPNYTTGRYSGAAPGSGKAGEYWVNTYALDKRPLYELPALTLHEAAPGHHLQTALAHEVGNAPDFRRRFYPHAFGEGWGLYAEKLGVEMGVYKSPYDQFGRLSYEMWRACRLVIDTGLHAKSWTRQQSIDYLASNTALSLHNVETEVDRYIAWPGQAVAYKIGELTLWELRRRAETALGPDFDVGEFHDAVLTEGGMPLELLSRRIDNYIAERKNR